MKLSKKGISPLIATVLIIGFTVALAAIIMTWGTSFSKSMQKTTESTTEEQLACAQDVNVDLSSACVVDGTAGSTQIKLTIKNDGAKAIERLSVRFYKDADNVASDTTTLVGVGVNPFLSSYGLDTKTVVVPIPLAAAAETVTLVELIPVIKVGEKELTCAATKDYFGDQSYEEALVACA
ncbi:MAG: hypothetical protein KJ955_05405 [Nanoarchaeota archaeon]|nr:hypothetical protein [Nanoarchaeota archaeon]